MPLSYSEQRAALEASKAVNQEIFTRCFKQAQEKINSGEMRANEAVWYMLGTIESSFGCEIGFLVNKE